jgi:hypothetical protein
MTVTTQLLKFAYQIVKEMTVPDTDQTISNNITHFLERDICDRAPRSYRVSCLCFLLSTNSAVGMDLVLLSRSTLRTSCVTCIQLYWINSRM